MEVKFYDLTAADNLPLKFAVIASTLNGKWVYCRHKMRDTWEIPGGHIEPGETPVGAAERELREETGAVEFDLKPLCVYSVTREAESCGLLCYAEIYKLNEHLTGEIGEIRLFEREPENLTYPDIQPKLFRKVQEMIHLE